jgi:hypothetical protein
VAFFVVDAWAATRPVTPPTSVPAGAEDDWTSF